MVRHHLTDEVSDPASPRSPCLCFSFFFFFLVIPDEKTEKKNHNYPQSPGVYSCQRLDCTASNQPLSGEDGALRAAASGGTDGYRPGLWLLSRLQSSMFVDVGQRCSGSGKTVMSHDIISPLNWFSKNSAPLDREEYDPSVFTGCQKGNKCHSFR